MNDKFYQNLFSDNGSIRLILFVCKFDHRFLISDNFFLRLCYYYVIVIYTMLMSILELKFIVLDETIFLILIEPIMKNLI